MTHIAIRIGGIGEVVTRLFGHITIGTTTIGLITIRGIIHIMGTGIIHPVIIKTAV